MCCHTRYDVEADVVDVANDVATDDKGGTYVLMVGSDTKRGIAHTQGWYQEDGTHIWSAPKAFTVAKEAGETTRAKGFRENITTILSLPCPIILYHDSLIVFSVVFSNVFSHSFARQPFHSSVLSLGLKWFRQAISYVCNRFQRLLNNLSDLTELFDLERLAQHHCQRLHPHCGAVEDITARLPVVANSPTKV